MACLVTVFSAFAFMLFAALLSLYPLCPVNLNLDKRQIAAVTLILPVFLFIPVGSLPPFVCTEYSALIIALLFIAALAVSCGKKTAESAKLLCLALLSLSLLTLTLNFALEKGFPGDKFSLSLLCPVNILCCLNVAEILCAAAAEGCFLALAFYGGQTLNAMFAAVFTAVCSAIIISLAFPFSVGIFCGLSGLPLYIADFAFFWTAVFCLKSAVLKFSARW